MANLSPQAQGLVTKYANEPGVTPDQVANLTAIINSSQPLTDQVNDAVKNGHLKGFEALPIGTHAGGEYHPARQVIRLPPSMLMTPQGKSFDMAEPAFVLGHELQHGFNRASTRAANETFVKELIAEAKQPSPTHDYTQEIGKKIAQNRRDEAGAEVAGWNALVGQVKATNPNATVVDVFKANPGRAFDFVDLSTGAPTIRRNLNINPDLTISPNTANVEAMGVNYFDKKALANGGTVSIGHHGNSDYANYYGASAIGKAAEVDTLYAKPHNGIQPQMVVNMRQLRLSEQLLEENGIDLGKNNAGQKTYLDSSNHPPTAHLFQHTIRTHQYVNPILSDGLDVDIERAQSKIAPSPTDPDHKDHSMLEQIRAGVRAIDEKVGKPYDDMSERISRSLLAQCKDKREMYPEARSLSLPANALNRVDHVLLGKTGNIFAVQGGIDDPAHNRAYVPVEQAMRTPVEQSDQKLLAANQIIAQELEMSRQQELMRGLDDPGRGAPAMAR